MLGFAQLGFLDSMFGELGKIDTIVSTSIGSVIAIFLSIGMSPCEIFQLFLEIQFSDVIGGSIGGDFWKSFGFLDTEYFVAHIVDALIVRDIDPLITFVDFKCKFGKNLVITGCNVTKKQTDFFSVYTSPDMRVLDAMKISISVPIVTKSVTYNGDVYVDGCIADNYPIQYCLDDLESRFPGETGRFLGVIVTGGVPEKTDPKKNDTESTVDKKLGFKQFTTNLFKCVISKDRKYINRMSKDTAIIEVPSESGNFSMGMTEKLSLFRSGVSTGIAFRGRRRVVTGRRRSV